MKMLPLYNQLLESKRTEAGAEKIIQTFYDRYDKLYQHGIQNDVPNLTRIYNILKEPQGVIDKLKKIDISDNQNNLEAMAYLLGISFHPQNTNQINLEHLKSTFEDYNDLMGRGKIKPIVLSKKGGLRIGDNEPFGDFLAFQEHIHGQKNLYGQKDKRSGELVVDVDDKPVFDKNGIEIYDAFDVGRCIKYGYTTHTDKGMKPYSFCISNPKMTNNMWQSYRDSKGSTFYFIFDKNRDSEDPLHMVVFDNTSRGGVELTDANNHTGSVSEYGSDSEGYINYLESKGVSARDLMPNREYSDGEREESQLLGKQERDLGWFVRLPLEYKEKYIGRGHKLDLEQFMYISPNGDLVSKYIQLGHILDNKTQFDVLNSNQRKTYLRSRMNMITHYFSMEDDYERREGLNQNRFFPYELPHIPEGIRTEYIIKLSSFIPLEEDELEYVPEDKKEFVKKGSYMRDVKRDTVKNMVKDGEFSNELRWEVTKLYMETRLSRGHGKGTMVESEVFNYLTDDQQNLIMKEMVENGMIFSPDDWEEKIPKRFLKPYIEMIGKNGGSFPQFDLIPQALTDLFIKLMGDNNNWMNGFSLKEGSQDARDYYLMKSLEIEQPWEKRMGITSDMLGYGSDTVKQFYYKRYDKRLGHMTRANVKAGNSPYNNVEVDDVEFASPHVREEWYNVQLDKYHKLLTNLGVTGNPDDYNMYRDSLAHIMDLLVTYGKQTMPDTSKEFRNEAFTKIYNMSKLNVGEFVKKGFNTSEFMNFVEKYCPKEMVRSFIELIPKDAKWNAWANSSYLEDNNV